MTWNIGGGYQNKGVLLAEMEKWRPDVVLLQETPDGSASFDQKDLAGFWEGWFWRDAGDCGVLSRWPMEGLDTEQVGTWEEPQVLAVDGPGSKTLLVVNVRLMLPSLELTPFSESARETLANSNRRRVKQYPSLMKLIMRHLHKEDFDGVILGGDFNTDASARSLDPVRENMTDVWREAGRGWGGTVTINFPVARVDQLYTTGSLAASEAFVGETEMSDHRPVIADIVVDAK